MSARSDEYRSTARAAAAQRPSVEAKRWRQLRFVRGWGSRSYVGNDLLPHDQQRPLLQPAALVCLDRVVVGHADAMLQRIRRNVPDDIRLANTVTHL